MVDSLFDCDKCGSPVTMQTGTGRMYELRSGFFVEIPPDTATATCEECRQIYLRTRDAEDLEKLLLEEYADKLDEYLARRRISNQILDELSRGKNG